MNAQVQLSGRRHGAPLFYAGWAGFALFGTIAAVGSHAVLSYAVFHVLVAAAICTWYAMTTGRAAPVVGAVLGALFFLQMGLFFSSDVINGEPLKITLADGFGLLAAILILIGAILGVRHHRGSLLSSDQSADNVKSPTSR